MDHDELMSVIRECGYEVQTMEQYVKETKGEHEMDQKKREYYGREVRRVWVEFAKEQGDTKPGHLIGWNELDEANKEVDMRIGEAIVEMATLEYMRMIENEKKLLALLKEAETLILTAPTSGGPTLSNPKWHEWQEKKTVWLKRLSHTLIVELDREEQA